MTKFLLRDGSLIDIDTEAAPEDVFSYTNTDGTTIHAALSEQEQWGLLIPWRGSRGLGNQLAQVLLSSIVARLSALSLNLTFWHGPALRMPLSDLDAHPQDPQHLLRWLLEQWPSERVANGAASWRSLDHAAGICRHQ